MAYKINIQNGSEPNVITNTIARLLGIDIEQKQTASIIHIPNTIGNGVIEQHNFKTGISVLDIRAKLNKAIDLNYDQGVLHPLKIIINRKAKIKHHFHDKDEPEYLNEQGSVTLASVAKQCHTIYLPKNQEIELLSIQIDRKKFESNIENFVSIMNPDLAQLFRDVNGVNPFFFESYYNYETTEALQKYFSCNYGDIVKNLYLEGLAYQLISLQLDTYTKNSMLDKKQQKLSRNYEERILKASSILKSDISSFSTISNLANAVGLTEKKLQQGFQHMFGKTVLDYVTAYKMEVAKNLLRKPELSISEISYNLGISSPSYFSKLFKHNVGICPKQYKKQHKNPQITSI